MKSGYFDTERKKYIITEYLLGVQATFHGLRIKLCIPAELDGTKYPGSTGVLCTISRFTADRGQ